MESNVLKINGIYKHFKGDYYIVLDVATDADSLEKCILYRALYGDGLIMIRRYDDFLSLVDKNKYPNVEQKFKFELQEIESVRDKFKA